MRHLILALFLILVTRSIGAAEPESGFDPCLETTQENRTKCEETCSDDYSLREKIACRQSCDVQWYLELKYCHQKTITMNF